MSAPRRSAPRFRCKQARETAALAKQLGYSVTMNSMGHLRCVHDQTGAIVICASKSNWHELRRDRSRLLKHMGAGDG